ncbi:hypothetical protein F5146DRAFT_181654 [Armillaria mellea]|nr:hypothetical protein F5146DRAFT_181654 [Armillaria mellea]
MEKAALGTRSRYSPMIQFEIFWLRGTIRSYNNCFIASHSPALTLLLLFVEGYQSKPVERASRYCRQAKSRWLRCRNCRWVHLQLVVRLRQRVRLARHRRRQARWADRCHIVMYAVCSFIATGAMILGPLDPFASPEILQVVRLSAWVMAYEAPEYVPPL